MTKDFRYAVRVLAAKPLFTLVAALSLALGIGANCAIFGVIDALWLRPLAVPRSGSIVRLFTVTEQDREGRVSYPEYLDFKQQASALTDVVAIGGRGAVLVEGDSHQLLTLNLVSSNFFTALGIRAEIGRVFTPQDEQTSSGNLVVVLGNSFWQRHFGGDPTIIGKTLRLQRSNDVLATIVGVLPPNFRQIDAGDDRDLWFSRQSWRVLGDVGELESPGNRWFRVIARVTPGASVNAACSQVETIAARMGDKWQTTYRGRRATVVSDLDYRLEQAGTTGLALLAIVFLVVTISSVNVANLLLSRAGFRGREIAVRLALGATRRRLIRQLMAENVTLGGLGLALGIAIGAALIQSLPAIIVQPPGFYSTVDFQFDDRVFLFGLAISSITILLFGLAPAWKSTSPDLVPALKGEAAFGSQGHRRWHLRDGLAVLQVAVSLTLIACAGVLVQSFLNTRTSDLGFGRKPLLLVWLAHENAKRSLYREVISHFEGMPGVRCVAAAVRAPLSLSSNGMFQRVTFPGRPDLESSPPFEIKYNSVSANFLSAMGTPILRGRGFERRDEMEGSTSVLINEAMARRFWRGEDAVGKKVGIGWPDRKLYTVIGVVKNAAINAVGELPEPYLYLPYWAHFEGEVTFLIETSGDPVTLAQAARRTLKQVDAALDPLSITTEDALIRFSSQRYQITAELVAGLGLLGLLLTVVGVYGVVSYGVSQRTRELGIRMALGADHGDTFMLVLRDVALIGLAGTVAGLPLGMAATRLCSSLLLGIDPWDLPTFAGACVVLAAVLFAAGWIPAKRATAIEPLSALRVV